MALRNPSRSVAAAYLAAQTICNTNNHGRPLPSSASRHIDGNDQRLTPSSHSAHSFGGFSNGGGPPHQTSLPSSNNNNNAHHHHQHHNNGTAVYRSRNGILHHQQQQQPLLLLRQQQLQQQQRIEHIRKQDQQLLQQQEELRPPPPPLPPHHYYHGYHHGGIPPPPPPGAYGGPPPPPLPPHHYYHGYHHGGIPPPPPGAHHHPYYDYVGPPPSPPSLPHPAHPHDPHAPPILVDAETIISKRITQPPSQSAKVLRAGNNITRTVRKRPDDCSNELDHPREDIQIVIGDTDDFNLKNGFGCVFEDKPPSKRLKVNAAREYACVKSIREGSSAEICGLQPGDYFMRYGSSATPASIQEVLSELKNKSVRLQVARPDTASIDATSIALKHALDDDGDGNEDDFLKWELQQEQQEQQDEENYNLAINSWLSNLEPSKSGEYENIKFSNDDSTVLKTVDGKVVEPYMLKQIAAGLAVSHATNKESLYGPPNLDLLIDTPYKETLKNGIFVEGLKPLLNTTHKKSTGIVATWFLPVCKSTSSMEHARKMKGLNNNIVALICIPKFLKDGSPNPEFQKLVRFRAGGNWAQKCHPVYSKKVVKVEPEWVLEIDINQVPLILKDLPGPENLVPLLTLAEKKARRKAWYQKRRENMTEEQKAARNAARNAYEKERKENMTEEQKAASKAYQKEWRDNMTEEQKEKKRATDKKYKTKKRSKKCLNCGTRLAAFANGLCEPCNGYVPPKKKREKCLKCGTRLARYANGLCNPCNGYYPPKKTKNAARNAYEKERRENMTEEQPRSSKRQKRSSE